MLFLLLLAVAAGYWGQKMLYARFWHRGLSVRAEFTDPYVYEGDTSCLKEEIINDKLLPLTALEIWLKLDRNLKFSDDAKENASISDQTYRRDVFSLLFHQRIVRRLSFVCQKRGFYRLTGLELLGYDLFLSAEHHRDLPQQTQFYVYPAQISTRRIRLVCRALDGMVLVQNRLNPDPFEFSGIREYQPTDPMNQINWKASARNHSLMVNQFDSTTSLKVTVFLDVEDSYIMHEEKLTEEGIRIAASLAVRLAKANMELTLLGNARYMDWSREEPCLDTLSWHLKTGERRIQDLYRRLACIDVPATAEPISAVLHREAQKKPSGGIYVLISKNQETSILEELQLLASGGNGILWVLPAGPGGKVSFSAPPQIRILKWEVDG